MRVGIFLDDERFPSDVTWISLPDDVGWYKVRNHFDFGFLLKDIEEIEKVKLQDVVFSFDHDIQSYDAEGDEVTGYHCLKELVGYCVENKLPLPECHFHSQNIIGVRNMKEYYDFMKLKIGDLYD